MLELSLAMRFQAGVITERMEMILVPVSRSEDQELRKGVGAPNTPAFFM